MDRLLCLAEGCRCRPRRLVGVGQDVGPAHLNPDLEAVTLMTMSAGPGTTVIDYRLFPALRPTLHRAAETAIPDL